MNYPIIRPVGNRILAEPVPAPAADVKPSMIQIPDAVRHSMQQSPGNTHWYRVIRCGTGKTNRKGIKPPFEVIPGDLVVSQTHMGQDISCGTAILKILESHEILAVLHP